MAAGSFCPKRRRTFEGAFCPQGLSNCLFQLSDSARAFHADRLVCCLWSAIHCGMEVNDSQGVLERVAARDARRRAELDKAVHERQWVTACATRADDSCEKRRLTASFSLQDCRTRSRVGSSILGRMAASLQSSGRYIGVRAVSVYVFLSLWGIFVLRIRGCRELQPNQEQLQSCAAELESLQQVIQAQHRFFSSKPAAWCTWMQCTNADCTLVQDLAAAAYYLPTYDSKQAQATLEGLHSQLSTLKSKNKPKAKFSFGSRATCKAPPLADPAADDIPAVVPPPAAPSARCVVSLLAVQ